MSVKYLAWALDLEMVDTAHKMVLVVLANRANDDGECWPGQESIGKQASMSESSVRRKLDGLERAGLITRHKRGAHSEAGGRMTDVYRLHMVTGQIDRKPLPVNSGEVTGQNGAGYRSRVTAKTSVEPKEEPSELSPASPSEGMSMATVAQVQYLRDLHMLMGGWRSDIMPDFGRLSVAAAGESIREAEACLEQGEYRDPPPIWHPTHVALSGRARSLLGRWKVNA